MVLKALLLAGVAAICALSTPRGPVRTNPAPPEPKGQITIEGRLPSPDEFLALAQSDPVALFEACLRRFKQEVHGFRAELHKQERVKGTLNPPEVVRVSVREAPFAVRMIWESGIKDDVAGTVYAAGENAGLMTVWRPTKFIKFVPLNPKEGLAAAASRYCITDSSQSHALTRSFIKWSDARTRGALHYEFLGVQPIPETGGRECLVLRRTCSPAEVDNFTLADATVRDPAADPAHAAHEITYYIDVQTWLQIGTVLKRADGELVGTYFFRNVELNPTFTAQTFTPDGFKK